ncbi:MAG: hypothetical protein JJU23_01840 [Cyclobacteriaceae bacterium]|nr:hypothetical protein [Cyclobacteriaceae bacterium]
MLKKSQVQQIRGGKAKMYIPRAEVNEEDAMLGAKLQNVELRHFGASIFTIFV